MKRILSAIAAALLTAALLAGCAGGSSGGKKLTVGVRKNLANFSSYSEEADTYYGFEADLAEALAKEMGYSGVKFVGLDPEERESALENGQVDCLIAAFSYTESRAEKFDLSTPYYHDAGRVMVEKSTLFSDYADLKNSTVAVRSGTTARDNLAAKLQADGLIRSAADLEGFLNIAEYTSYEEMNAALEYGDADALCADGCITLPWLDEERAYFEEAYSQEDYVIATAKGSRLTAKAETALTALSENGTLTKLETKWGVTNEEK